MAIDIRQLHHVAETWKSIASLLLNFLLAYLVLYRSPPPLRMYRRILLMTCVTDVFLGTTVLIVQPAIFLTSDGYMILTANGFVANKSSLWDHVGFALYCMLLHANIACVVMQFVLRHISLCAENGKKQKKLCVIAFAVFWCLLEAAIAVWTFVQDDTAEMRTKGLAFLDEIGWQYSGDAVPFPAAPKGLKVVLHHGFYGLTGIGGYFVIGWCQYRMKKYLRKQSTEANGESRKLHEDVDRAFQALDIAPLITLVIALSVVAYHIICAHPSGLSSVLLTVMASAIALVNPLTTIYFIRPYRNAVFGAMSCGMLRNLATTQPTFTDLVRQSDTGKPDASPTSSVGINVKEEELCPTSKLP